MLRIAMSVDSNDYTESQLYSPFALQKSQLVETPSSTLSRENLILIK